jgi:predicted MFS family arabinose efflux permease
MSARHQPRLFLTVAGGVLALAISQGIGRFAYTPLLPAMQSAAGFGPDVAGYLAAANYAGYLVGAFLVALLPPRWSRTLVLRVSLIVSIVTTAAMALTTSLWAWGVLRTVAGLASAGVLIIACDIVFRRLTGDRRESLKGLPFGGVGAGIAISGAVVAATLARWGWAGGWTTLGLIAALLAPVCWIGLRTPRAAHMTREVRAEPHATTRYSRFPVPLLLAAYFCEGLGYIVSATFLVAIVAGMPALSDLAPYTWIVVGLAACVAAPLWGALASRAGLVGTLIAAHVVQALGIAAPLLGHSLVSVLFSALAFGSTISSISALSLSLGGLLAPEKSGRLIGLLTAVFGIGQILGPIVAGVLAAERGDFDMALMLAASVVMLGALFLALGATQAARQTAAALARPG